MPPDTSATHPLPEDLHLLPPSELIQHFPNLDPEVFDELHSRFGGDFLCDALPEITKLTPTDLIPGVISNLETIANQRNQPEFVTATLNRFRKHYEANPDRYPVTIYELSEYYVFQGAAKGALAEAFDKYWEIRREEERKVVGEGGQEVSRVDVDRMLGRIELGVVAGTIVGIISRGLVDRGVFSRLMARRMVGGGVLRGMMVRRWWVLGVCGCVMMMGGWGRVASVVRNRGEKAWMLARRWVREEVGLPENEAEEVLLVVVKNMKGLWSSGEEGEDSEDSEEERELD